MIPGYRPSGIITAGVAQRMVNIEGVLPGRRAVILGSGDIGLIMARRLHLEGVEVVAVLEKMPAPGGLLRNVVQCLEDFEIPLLLSHTVSEVHGRNRLEGVTITEVDDQGRPIPNSEDFLSVDTLILSVGLIPDTEIASGEVALNNETGGFLVDSQMQTESEWLFAAGNDVIIFDLADWVALVGERAGKNAAARADGASSPENSVPLIRGSGLVHLAPSRLVSGDSAHLFLRVDRPVERGRLQIGSTVSQTLVGARPSEMIDMALSKEQVRELCDGEPISVEVVAE
jgi:NADPH-dependent 2,4-dienoyl-CoA reductase/sulfur reductase-like enzyme